MHIENGDRYTERRKTYYQGETYEIQNPNISLIATNSHH